MMDSSNQIEMLQFVLFGLLWLIVWLVPMGGGLYLANYLLGLPLRRSERARVFLDLLELGLRDGQAPEQVLIDISICRDPSLGRHFHQLGAHLKGGHRLHEALEMTPGLLPPRVVAMLAAGEEIGDIRRVLPACRQLLGDGRSQARTAVDYIVIIAFVFTPITLFVLTMMAVKVLPQFHATINSMMEETPLPEMGFVSQHIWGIIGLQLGLMLSFWAVALCYVGGPRLAGWAGEMLGPLISRVQFTLPWRRLRMKRDFSSMLAILLDAGMAESRALMLAADSTANAVFRARAQRAVAGLAAGGKLTDAVRALDDSGEFQWRLRNATHASGGFFHALKGWMEALDAKAFQREQATAQVLTTGMVLFNGLIIGTLVYSIYQPIMALIEAAVLW